VIEQRLVACMARRCLWIAPAVMAGAWVLGGPGYALSALVGLVMTLANLWLAARIIGGVAQSNPALLMGAGFAAFALGLALLTAIAFWLQTISAITFPVTGFVLIGAHLLLVLWVASDAYPNGDENKRPGGVEARS
jgi:hypothetical protein